MNRTWKSNCVPISYSSSWYRLVKPQNGVRKGNDSAEPTLLLLGIPLISERRHPQALASHVVLGNFCLDRHLAHLKQFLDCQNVYSRFEKLFAMGKVFTLQA